MHHRRWRRRRRPAPHTRLVMLRRDGWQLRLTTIEVEEFLHGHECGRSAQLQRSKRQFCLDQRRARERLNEEQLLSVGARGQSQAARL